VKHPQDEDDYDSALEIVDLDPKESAHVQHRTTSSYAASATKSIMPAAATHLPPRWLRWGMALLTCTGSLFLLFLLWPTVAPSLRISSTRSLPVIPAPSYAYQDVFSLVLPANNVTYIYARNDQKQPSINSLIAVNASNGKLVWRYRGGMAGIPLLQDNVLYVPTAAGIDAFQADDRSLLWHRHMGSSINGLSVENHVLYVTSSQSRSLYALRINDGTLLWHLTPDEFVVQADRNIVYTSSSSGSNAILNARSARDGTLLWQHEVLNNDLQLDHNVVYAPLDTSIVALRASNGSTLWNRNGIGNILAKDGNLIVTSSLDGNSVIALRSSDGMPIWHYDVQNVRQSQISNGVLYLKTTNKDNLFALNASNGTLLWHVQAPGDLLSVDNGILCFEAPLPFPQNDIYALRTSDGTVLWHHTRTGDQPEQMQNGVVYIVSAIDGKLTALRASNGLPLWQYPLPV
jgi:outer membrane protein assembly factor BamB